MFNHLFPSSTTWKYPSPKYNGAFHQFQDSEQKPDRKMFFLIIATPLTGPVHDPGQAQHGFVIDKDGTHDLYPARAQFERAGSIVDKRFGPPQPVAGPSKQPDVEVIKEGQTQDDPPYHVTRSKGKQPAQEKQSGDESDDDDVKNMKQAFIKALEINQANVHSECAKHNGGVEPPGVVDEYGWSENQTIMIKPTFKVWWRGMAYCKYVRTTRFSSCRRGDFRK